MENPYAPPRARVQDLVESTDVAGKTPWGRAAQFYWAFLWRMLLIFAGMTLPFIAIYGFVQWLLSAWPLFERGVRLLCILTLLALSSCFAIQWAAKSRFGGLVLRVLITSTGADSTPSPPSDELTFGRAARLLGSHLWRYVLVVAPVNVLLQLVVARHTVLTSGGPRLLQAQAINTVVGLLVGVWAMREALSVTYTRFHLEWIAADSTTAPNGAETPPASPSPP